MKRQWLKAVVLMGLAACSGGTGDVVFTTYGEDFIEQEIPASAFEDGWSVKFTKFLVTLGEVKVANVGGEVGAEASGARVYDVHRAGPVEVERFRGLAAEDWQEVSFAIAPSSEATMGNASAEDVERMKTGGWGVYVEGTGMKGEVTKHFAWGFAQDTLYERCGHPDLGEGLTVPSGGEEVVQLTIHGDHLFFDDLQSPEAKMRFEAIAAADGLGIAGPDGEVTLEELEAVDLTTLPRGTYGTGGAGNVRTLKDFLHGLVRTVGHYRGEGECAPRAR